MKEGGQESAASAIGTLGKSASDGNEKKPK